MDNPETSATRPMAKTNDTKQKHNTEN